MEDERLIMTIAAMFSAVSYAPVFDDDLSQKVRSKRKINSPVAFAWKPSHRHKSNYQPTAYAIQFFAIYVLFLEFRDLLRGTLLPVTLFADQRSAMTLL